MQFSTFGHLLLAELKYNTETVLVLIELCSAAFLKVCFSYKIITLWPQQQEQNNNYLTVCVHVHVRIMQDMQLEQVKEVGKVCESWQKSLTICKCKLYICLHRKELYKQLYVNSYNCAYRQG